jgi:hypothetical protein
MIHVALIASLVVVGLGPPTARPDSAPGNVSTSSNPDTTVTPSGGPAPFHEASGPLALPVGFTRGARCDPDLAGAASGPADTIPHRTTRPRAIEYSDWYYRRLTMHRIGSYVEFPLFAAEYVLGDRLLHDQQQLGFVPPGQHPDARRVPPGLLTAHTLVAGGLAVLFGFNTVTGGWNLWESRKEPIGRTRRIVHTVLMLAADAGFAATGAAGGGAKHSLSNADTHRGLAEASMGVAGAGTIMMWVWNH